MSRGVDRRFVTDVSENLSLIFEGEVGPLKMGLLGIFTLCMETVGVLVEYLLLIQLFSMDLVSIDDKNKGTLCA